LINNRGIFVPKPVFGAGAEYVGAAFLIAVGGAIGLRVGGPPAPASGFRCCGPRSP
jgi:hypothetical protein